MPHDDLIELIYATAHRSERWEIFLDALIEGARLGAAAVGYRPDIYSPFITGFMRGPGDDQIEDFFARGVPADPLSKLAPMTPLGKFFVRGAALVPHDAFTETAYYDWMCANGFDEVFISGERHDGDAMTLITVFTRPDAPMNPERKALIEQLTPHICRALVLGNEWTELERQHRQALSAIEHTHFGCFLLGKEGRVEWMNEQARLLLEDARSIASEEDHFKLCGELLESIDSVQRGDESRDGMHPHVVDLESVSRSHRRLELQLIEQQTFVSPLASSKTPQTLVFLADPDHLDAGLEARMQVLYGLTRAEACVARYIVSGYSVENISHILAKSENTVRVQLKSTMRKCKVGSQAQFVGLVHRGLATLR